MESFLRKAWAVVTDKLGAIANFIPAIAEKIEVAIKEEKVEDLNESFDELEARSHEMREVCDAIDQFVNHGRQAIADGNLSAVEGARAGLLLERIVDEAEDVVTGVDEDDVPPEPEPTS